MARAFSYPKVTSLEIGDLCFVLAPLSEVKRKVALYAARNNKRFAVEGNADSTAVRRLPVTDTELPGVA